MKLNYAKSNYIIFTRNQTEFTSRLTLGNKNVEQVKAIKLLGVWITSDLSWDLNCQEMIRKAYSRIPLLTKLKYVGTCTEDLLTIYKLFIRSCLEYCSVTFHSSLTVEQSDMLERAQRVCMKVILSDMYIDTASAREMCSLSTLHDRRLKRCTNFSLRALQHKKHKNMFPISEKFKDNTHDLRNPEKFVVNQSRGEKYRRSTIPFLQRHLNTLYFNKKV